MTQPPATVGLCEEGAVAANISGDMTVMTGRWFRRYRFANTHRSGDLGPFISCEMNRCIACYRCVRYYKDMPTAPISQASIWRAHDETSTSGVRKMVRWKARYSGNLVEILRPDRRLHR